MAPVVNARAVFNSIPAEFPEIGKTIVHDATQTIDPDTVPLDGGFLIKILDVSIDPYMRGRMREASEADKKSYSPPFTIGEAINGFAVGVVLRSESSEAKPGDHVYGALEFQNYIIKKSLRGSQLRIIENKAKLPWSAFIGVLGMPGKTAYMAWKEYSHAEKGDIAFVTAGAGPVGSLVIQLAKSDGLKVIASAGSQEKVEFLKELGADVVFNYKATDTAEILAREGPIDLYWDNVGGTTLEAALDAASEGARFIECGMISGYNTGGQPIRNLALIIGKSITLYGFNNFRLQEKYEEDFYATMEPKVASGEIKYREHIFDGLDKVGEAIIAVQKGTNKAKAVVHVAGN